MGLLDSSGEEPRSKAMRWTVTTLLLVILTGFVLWFLLRFQTEKNTAAQFLQTLADGNTQRAYELWQPGPNYTYEMFLEDWGPTGEFGPVGSFRVVTAERPRNRSGTIASGVIVVVEISPQKPFDGASPGIKEVHLWVERRDQSLSFPP